jgi:ADP-ribose pyrophosphatase
MSTNYKVIDTEILFDHQWAKIVVDTIEFQGTRRPYFYVASPVEAVATIGLTSADEIILTRQYRHPVREVIYDLPAGRLELGESPIDGARREFEEETGFYPHHIEQIGYYNQFPGTLRAGTNLFFARDLEPTKQKLDEGEALDIIMMAVPEVLEMVIQGKVIDGSLQLAILLALKKGLISIHR